MIDPERLDRILFNAGYTGTILTVASGAFTLRVPVASGTIVIDGTGLVSAPDGYDTTQISQFVTDATE
jgi:hypothetical protein